MRQSDQEPRQKIKFMRQIDQETRQKIKLMRQSDQETKQMLVTVETRRDTDRPHQVSETKGH